VRAGDVRAALDAYRGKDCIREHDTQAQARGALVERWEQIERGGTIEPHAVLTAEAVNVLTSKLRTPLRMQWHLTQALEAGYRAGVSPVPVDLLETASMTPL